MSYRKVKTGNARRQTTVRRKQTPGTKGTGSGAGKKVLAVLTVILVLGFVGSTVAGMVVSPSRGKCKAVITDFQTACNELDVDGILDCLKPSVSNPLKIALGIGSVVTSKSSDEMLEGILDALGGGMGEITERTGLGIDMLFETMELKPVKYGMPAKVRKVKCRAILGGLEQEISIYVTKQYGEPYITKISFFE